MKGLGKTIVLTVLFTSIVVFGGLFVAVKYNVFGLAGANATPVAVKETISPAIEILTNLKSSPEYPHYIKAKISISVNGKNDLKRVTDSEAVLRDSYIQVFGNLTVDQMRDNSKLDDIKKQLITKAEQQLGVKIYNLYFVDYLIQ